MQALLMFSYSAMAGLPLVIIAAALYALVHQPKKKRFEAARDEYDRLYEECKEIDSRLWPDPYRHLTEEYQEADRKTTEAWHKMMDLNPRGF